MIINQKIYFIHVPRTGGRFIRDSLIKNNYNVQLYFYNVFYKGKEIPHLTYPEYEQFLNYTPLKNFAIVREPVDRFISMIKHGVTFNEEKINKMFRTEEDFNQTINREILTSSSNWFVPQINFINYHTKIWKFEDGFGKKWIEWMMNNFEIKILEFPIKQQDNYVVDNFSLNKEKIQYIKNYYYKDYKLLNY
jgi:hypothetical protein